MKGHRLVLALTLLATAAQAQPPAAELAPVPYPDLSPLEPAVAAQLGEVQDLARSTLEDPQATPAAVAEAYGELGRHYHAYGLGEAARVCYANAETLAPQDARWPYLRGSLLQGQGSFEEAGAAFRRSLDIDETNLPAWIHLGEIELTLDHSEAAEAAAQLALDLAPASPAARALLGQVALSQQRWRDAVEALEAALAQIPEADRLHYPLGLAYRGLGDMQQAREHLARAGSVGVRPPDPWLEELETLKTGERVHLLRGRRAFQAGDFAAAAEAFRRATASRPESARAHVNLGSALGQMGDQQGAVEQYRAALELDPANTTAHFNLALMLLQQGALEEAASHLKAVVEAEPGDREAHLQLARALKALGRTAEALPHFRRAVEIDPAREEPRLEEAQALIARGDLQLGRQRLEEAHTDLPTSGQIANALARLLASSPDLELRDGPRAVDLALRVFEARPTVTHAETVALALAEAGRCSQAATWQQRALEAARRLQRPDLAAALAEELARYQAGPPCRPEGGGMPEPPPATSRGRGER